MPLLYKEIKKVRLFIHHFLHIIFYSYSISVANFLRFLPNFQLSPMKLRTSRIGNLRAFLLSTVSFSLILLWFFYDNLAMQKLIKSLLLLFLFNDFYLVDEKWFENVVCGVWLLFKVYWCLNNNLKIEQWRFENDLKIYGLLVFEQLP